MGFNTKEVGIGAQPGNGGFHRRRVGGESFRRRLPAIKDADGILELATHSGFRMAKRRDLSKSQIPIVGRPAKLVTNFVGRGDGKHHEPFEVYEKISQPLLDTADTGQMLGEMVRRQRTERGLG